MARTQLHGTQVQDNTIRDVDIAPDAAIAISKINGLQAALDSKAATPIAGSAVSLSTTNFTKNLSSSETTVQQAMDKLDDMAVGGGDTIIIETLSADKILTSDSERIQVLDVNGAIRRVTLPASGLSAGDCFTIRNNSTNSSNYYLIINKSTNPIDYISGGNEKSYRWSGSDWILQYNDGIHIGAKSKGWSSGIGIGTGASASTYSIGIGPYATSTNYGVGIGYGVGASGGAAIGNGANGMNNGTAIGNNADGNNGTAVGYYANASTNGVAIGGEATINGKQYSAAFGNYTKCERAREIAFSASGTTTNKSNTCICLIKEKSLTGITALTEVFLDASSARLSIISNSIVQFELQYNAIDTSAKTCKCWLVTGAIKNTSTVCALVGTPQKTIIAADTGTDAWDIQVTADDTNKSLKLEFMNATGITTQSGGSFIIRDTRI